MIEDTLSSAWRKYALFNEAGKLVTVMVNDNEVAPVYNGSISESNEITLTYDRCVSTNQVIQGGELEETIDRYLVGFGGTQSVATVESTSTDPVDGLVNVITSPDKTIAAGKNAIRFKATPQSGEVCAIVDNSNGSVSEPYIGAEQNLFIVEDGVITGAFSDFSCMVYNWFNRVYTPYDEGGVEVQSEAIVGQSVSVKNFF